MGKCRLLERVQFSYPAYLGHKECEPQVQGSRLASETRLRPAGRKEQDGKGLRTVEPVDKEGRYRGKWHKSAEPLAQSGAQKLLVFD
jgi:hypothetical protein